MRTSHPLLATDAVAVWDVLCPGTCRHKSDEECLTTTHLVFPYRGIFVHHTGDAETVAEANQVVFLNESEPYRVSHPIGGGDASLSIAIDAATLLELAPADVLHGKDRIVFNRPRMRIDARAQVLAALVRQRLARGVIETLEAEDLIFSLVSRALGKRTSYAASGSAGRQKLVDRAKLVLSSDLGRRWTLAEIGAAVGVSPVYLTQVFRQVEGLPLYRYHLQLRLARALDLLDDCFDLTDLALDLGFSSYSHFSMAFKQAYGLTPFAFRRFSRLS
ncbi:MAG TPA: AraC family transcriptional regulator [Pseudolabrys sp.]|nr:AraC family transcriptional regulator [Pseudolabrys sp.]